MTAQTELAGMPEPVVNQGKTLVAVFAEEGTKKKRKPPTKDRARGVIKINLDGENYTVRMKQHSISVRRNGKRMLTSKPLSEVVDFIIGQERLIFRDLDEACKKALSGTRFKPNPDWVPADH